MTSSILVTRLRKIHVVATSRANWPETTQGNGDPLDKLAIRSVIRTKTASFSTEIPVRYYDNLSKKLSDDFKPSIWTKDDQGSGRSCLISPWTTMCQRRTKSNMIKRRVTFKMDDRVKVNPDNEVVVPDETTTDTRSR